MLITIASTLMIFAAYFLLLYAGVGLIQDKRFFSSAPKELIAGIPDRKERFRGAHVIGWIVMAMAVLLFAGAFVLAGRDGVRNEFGYGQFFVRFLVMLYGMEIYDILFFDWFLLCHSNFYPHFYPELEGIAGPRFWGFNRREHILHLIVYIPVCAALAGICMLF